MVPIFALGRTVTGYASVDSTASIGSAEDMDNKILNARPDVVMETLEKVRRHRQEKFKSKFAKELNEQNLPVDNIRYGPSAKVKRDSTMQPELGRSDLNRLKLENKELTLNVENCLIEEKRYKHIQYELSQVRQTINKVIKAMHRIRY